MRKKILMSQVFAGSYLDEDSNIGHEIINMYEADDGQNYLYIPGSGEVNDAEDVENVFFVAHRNKHTTVEVVAIAVAVEPFDPKEIGNISYGGARLRDIFGDNTYNGVKEGADNRITFKANGGVFVPRKRMLLTAEDGSAFSKNDAPEGPSIIRLHLRKLKTLTNQKLRTYFPLDEEKDAYEELEGLIRKMKLWKAIDRPFILRSFDGDSSYRAETPAELKYEIMKSRFSERIAGVRLRALN